MFSFLFGSNTRKVRCYNFLLSAWDGLWSPIIYKTTFFKFKKILRNFYTQFNLILFGQNNFFIGVYEENYNPLLSCYPFFFLNKVKPCLLKLMFFKDEQVDRKEFFFGVKNALKKKLLVYPCIIVYTKQSKLRFMYRSNFFQHQHKYTLSRCKIVVVF